MTFPPMRPQIEVQHAHDLIMDVLSDPEARGALDLPVDLIRPLMVAADVLCWVLHHDVDIHHDCHASNFADQLFWLRHDLAEAGIEWIHPGEDYIVEE